MSSDVSEPKASEPASSSVPLSGPQPELPDPIQLFTDTFTSFSKDVGPYLLAGLGQFAVLLPVILILFMVLYFGMFAWIFGGFAVFGVVAAIGIELLGDSGLFIGMLAMFLWYAAGFALLFAVSVSIGAAMAPLNASLVRRVAAYQREERVLDFGATFSDAGQDIGSVIAVSLAVGSAISVGVMFLYLPGLLAMVLLGHATLLVAINRRGVLDAVVTSVRHVLEHPQYHAMYWLLYIGTAMVVTYIPIIGPMYLLAVHVRAHRHIFGDLPG